MSWLTFWQVLFLALVGLHTFSVVIANYRKRMAGEAEHSLERRVASEVPAKEGGHLFIAAWEHLTGIRGLWHYITESPVVLGRFILVAFAEELIWRAGAQRTLTGFLGEVLPASVAIAAGIVVVAVCFSFVHKHFFENAPLISAEFLAFAILLGLLYHWTGSFILVVVIHAVRDIEITFLEYQLKLEETGDHEEAVEGVEKSLMVRPRGDRRLKMGQLIQVPALYIAVGLGIYWGVFSRELVSPVHVAFGLLVGHLVFGVSLLVTLHTPENT